jgi:hypothetical protein
MQSRMPPEAPHGAIGSETLDVDSPCTHSYALMFARLQAAPKGSGESYSCRWFGLIASTADNALGLWFPAYVLIERFLRS